MNNILLGKTITAIYLDENKLSILFDISQGKSIIALCDADGGSRTWIENVELPALGFPCTVISAGDVEMPELETGAEQDSVVFYGFKILTDKGDILIDYRNESNGYYGGSLEWALLKT